AVEVATRVRYKDSRAATASYVGDGQPRIRKANRARSFVRSKQRKTRPGRHGHVHVGRVGKVLREDDGPPRPRYRQTAILDIEAKRVRTGRNANQQSYP